jgi:hypothetical protein
MERVKLGSLALALVLSCGVLGVACGGEESTFPDEKKDTNVPPGGSSGFNTTNTPEDACTEASKLVYVVSQERSLYSFAPNTLKFEKIGPLDCPAKGGASASSMAVDRKGTAWVGYSDGTLFKVSTKDASCTATSFAVNQHGFERFGMAFATNGADTTDETLFVSGVVAVEDASGLHFEGKGFGKLDLGTLQISLLGDYSGALAKQGAELTGTGDGRLYGFFTTEPAATLAQIDRAAGATSDEKTLGAVDTGNAFAFSFWGGDFWFYTAESSASSTPSKVTRLNTQTGELSVVVPNVGNFHIVGAGVSTCAPTTQPR